MDLRTVEENLSAGKYTTETQFAEDVRLVWENARTYNKVESEISRQSRFGIISTIMYIYDFAMELGAIFEALFAKVSKECEAQVKLESEKEVRSDVSSCGYRRQINFSQ